MEPYENGDSGFGAIGAIGIIIYLGILVLIIAGMWKTFSKAGKPGWAAIVPIYNTIVMLEIAGKPVWWILLLLIPVVNLILIIMVIHQIALSFGGGVGTTLLLLFLPFVGYPMLGFGSAQYTPPATAMRTA